MGVGAFAFPAKAIENGFRIRFGDLRLQVGRSIPDGKDRAPFLRRIMLNAAVTAGRLARMPICPAVVNALVCCQHRDFSVEARRLSGIRGVPPQMLRRHGPCGDEPSDDK